ncbi:MAG: sugar phosphate isomerase/epimerase [Planctomycetaceae bacterium]|nr:sugar phosphate isomerase/epimerase [Planctomycetaceae bacterium]
MTQPFQPRYAICQELFVGWDWQKQCEFTAECGYKGVEIAPFTMGATATDVSAVQRKEIRKTAEQAGLEIIGLHWLLAKTEGFYLTTNDAEVRQKTTDYFIELTRLCADLGGSLMVLGSPQQRNLLPGVSMEQANQNALDVLSGVIPELEKTGVTLCLEPLARTETDFMITCAQGADMIHRLGSPSVRLHQDVKAMSDEATPIPELIHQFKDLTGHFHANDVNLRGPGMGDVDFAPIFQALADTGYDGWISVEVFDYSPGAETIARESIEYMRKIAANVH